MRRAIDAALDASTLPDEVIGDAIYLTRALEYVASRTTDTGEHAKRAAISYLASLLVGTVATNVMALRSILAGNSAAKFDAAEKRAELEADAEAELTFILTGGEPALSLAAQRPTMFTLARGGRGR